MFGRIYEYFLTQFADQKAHDGGEFFTPISLVSFIANVLEPTDGTVFDPACGSGGMFVQSARFVEKRHGNRTFNLLIKSYVSRRGCTIDNCSRHNNLTITRPAWTVSNKRWESWRNRTASNCEGHKRTQRDQHGRSEHDAAAALVSMALHVSSVRVLCQNDQ